MSRQDAFRLADSLTKKPLKWSRSGSPSGSSVLSFVMFRGFVRALDHYRSIVLLLKSAHWEDALILTRSLYELNVNLCELSSDGGREEKARTFAKFGRFQQLRLVQMRLEDELRDERAKDPKGTHHVASERQLERVVSMLERDFAEFRAVKGKGKRKWQDSWSGMSAETLAQHLALQTGAQSGQHDYRVFRLASLFTHNAPGGLLLAAPQELESADWKTFRGALDKAGKEGQRFFLREASLCFIDIVGMAGAFIEGYERKWFDEFALPLLDRF